MIRAATGVNYLLIRNTYNQESCKVKRLQEKCAAKSVKTGIPTEKGSSKLINLVNTVIEFLIICSLNSPPL